MSRAELVRRLTLERFGKPVREYHNSRAEGADRLRRLAAVLADLEVARRAAEKAA